MWEPSFARNWFVGAAVLIAGCRKPPEADPAKVEQLAATMIANDPVPGGARPCTPNDLMGGATVTFRTLYGIANKKLRDSATMFDWVNPQELDAPAAITLADPQASTTDRRRAAAELLAAPFYLAYIVDSVDAPMPLGIKEDKRGTVGARALRYDKTGAVVCIHVFQWQNSAAKHAWAVEKNKLIVMMPEVQKALQDDLRAQMLVRIGSLAAPDVPPIAATPTKVHDSDDD